MRPGPADWHDAECGSYAADLALWRELARRADGPVLDIGAGTGRVALDLARAGHAVTAVDSEPELVAAVARRAREEGLVLRTAVADARTLDCGGGFALALMAMQVVQLLGGPGGRARALERAAAALAPGGRVAVAIADPFEAVPAGDALPPLPDVLERDGWVLSSLPVAVRELAGGVAIDRVRQSVSPAGELSDELATVEIDALGASQLESEGLAAGLRAAERRDVAPTADHVGSTVVILERA